MKRKIVVITILLIVTRLVLINPVKIKDSEVEKMPKQVKNTNMLTMMLETEAGTGSYEEVTQSEWPQDGYVFNASLSRCENGGTLSWDDNAKKIILNTDVSDKCYVYFDIYNEPTFAEYIINNVYTEDGVNGLYYHDGVGTYTNSSEEAGDNSYRYSGANPNNYVCFGSDVTTCPNDNLYRIIGLFDDDKDGTYNVKLIKNSSYGEYVWDEDYDTTWNATTKPDIYTTLNETYYNTLSDKWQNLIDQNHIWKIGRIREGFSGSSAYSDIVKVKEFYNEEIGINRNGYEETMHVGLMYASDYGYGASPVNWTTILGRYGNDTNRNNNWMYLNIFEWTICHNVYTDDWVFQINSKGAVNLISIYDSKSNATRPSFYLKPEVILAGGTGTLSDPYRI